MPTGGCFKRESRLVAEFCFGSTAAAAALACFFVVCCPLVVVLLPSFVVGFLCCCVLCPFSRLLSLRVLFALSVQFAAAAWFLCVLLNRIVIAVLAA